MPHYARFTKDDLLRIAEGDFFPTGCCPADSISALISISI